MAGLSWARWAPRIIGLCGYRNLCIICVFFFSLCFFLFSFSPKEGLRQVRAEGCTLPVARGAVARCWAYDDDGEKAEEASIIVAGRHGFCAGFWRRLRRIAILKPVAAGHVAHAATAVTAGRRWLKPLSERGRTSNCSR